VALDESMTSARTLDTSAALGLVPVVNLKGGRVGGPGPAMEILHRTRSAGLDVFVGGMLSTCVGRLHDVALAAQRGVTLASDLAGSDWYLDTDLVDPPLRLRPDGTLVVPSGPGLGARVLLDRVEAATVLSRKVTPKPG
jgi:O-succinylbenzoate synthase